MRLPSHLTTADPSPFFATVHLDSPPVLTNPQPSRPHTLQLPSLDFSNPQVAQAGQYWPGATTATGALPPSHTLPTPPGAESDVYKPPALNREPVGSGATSAIHANMASNVEPSLPASSFTARKSAASNLPQFELPPPQPLNTKYNFQSINNSMTASQAAPATLSVGNLLTPPSNISGDSLSPISAGAQSNGPAANGLPPFTPSAFWQQPTGTTPLGMASSSWPQGSNALYPGRFPFSPSSITSLNMRTDTGSPSTSGSLPPPPPQPTYDLSNQQPLPQFTGNMPASTTLPPITAQQQQHQHHQNQQQQQQQIQQQQIHQQQHQQLQHQQQNHQTMPQYNMGMPTPVSATARQGSPTNGTDPYSQRTSQTPSYYSGSQPSSTPQQAHFPNYQNQSPVQQSPMSAGMQQPARLSPTNGQIPHGQIPNFQSVAPPQNQVYMRYPSYPGINGPIMSNVQNPGGPVTMLGGPAMPGHMGQYQPFNSGLAAQIHGGYSNNHSGPHTDRPFKCDQCPQSFNRNHDLKRHKRIHLAVKPFPCKDCDKSFSRKDALKVSPRDFLLI